MPGLVGRLYRGAKRRIKQGIQDQKTHRLYQGACRLLEHKDHEQISVALLAREAGISVGAFYQRYRTKDAFLGMVVAARLDSMQYLMQRELEPERWRGNSASVVTQAIVEVMLRRLHGPSAGVVRAALKRGHLDRKTLKPLLQYRQALADSAVALLAHRAKGVRKPERAVRSAMQVVEAAALDALLHEGGALRPGSQRMADTLSAMVCAMLGLPRGKPAERRHSDEDAPDSADDDGEEAMLDMPAEDLVAIPLPAPPPSSLSPAKRRKAEQAQMEELFEPLRPKQPAREKVEQPGPLVKGRKRPRY